MRWSLVFLVACGGGAGFPDAHFGDDFPPPFFPDASPDATVCRMICNGVCIDTDIDPHHCGSCTNACTTDKPECAGGTCYQPQQTLWVTHFGGADFGSAIDAVATDASGNVYVTGSLTGSIDLGGGTLTSAGATDILVASFTSSGVHRWSKRFGSTDIDQGAGIAVSPTTGQLYIIANFLGSVDFGGGALVSAGGQDIALVELDANSGDYINARRYGTANHDTGIAVGMDGTGDVVLGGFFGQGTLDVGGFQASGTALDNAFVASVDINFTGRWTRALGGATGATDVSSCQALAVDPQGNVVVAGLFTGTANFGTSPVVAAGSDAFVASLDTFGNPRWSHVFGGPQDDSADAIALDLAGNITVGGSYHGNVDFGTGAIPSTGSLDGFVLGYTSTGGFRFARHIGATTTSRVSGIAITGTGSVIATGRLEGAVDFGTGALAPLGVGDAFVVELSAGTANYAKRFGGSADDEGLAVGVASGGIAIVGGQFRGTADFGVGATVGGANDNGFLMGIAP